MSELDLAYAAGVIDSDGTIGIHRKLAAKSIDGSRQDCYEPRVAVRQVDHEATDLLHDLFGGYLMPGKAYAKNGRPLTEWRVTGRTACSVLVELIPYLRIKKDRAENACELGRLNRMQKFRVPLAVDSSQGWVTLTEAAYDLAKPLSSLRGAVSRGQLPSTGKGKGRRVPLATVREWGLRRPGGPQRQPDVTLLMEECYRRSKDLNRVGMVHVIGI